MRESATPSYIDYTDYLHMVITQGEDKMILALNRTSILDRCHHNLFILDSPRFHDYCFTLTHGQSALDV